MKRLRILVLGAKLAVAGGRPAWTRVALMAFGFAVGSALLLSAMSIVPAMSARDARELARYGVRGPATEGIVRVWSDTEAFRDLEFTALWIRGRAEGDGPVPLGLTAVPAPGEIYLSPALAHRWSGDAAAALEARLDVDAAGTIGAVGLVDPHELVAWVGVPKGLDMPNGYGSRVTRFAPDDVASAPLDLAALLAVVGVAGAILIPIWLFVATATRLSAATREQRLAAVRLAGATESQIRTLASVEAGVAAAVGVLGGVPLFLASRSFLARGVIVDLWFFPSDFAPPLWLAIPTLVGLPLVAIAMSTASIRRLIVTPLGVVRRVPRRSPGWKWLVVFAAGIGILRWVASQHGDLTRWSPGTAGIVIVVGMACAAFGLIGSATWIAWAIARLVAGSARSVAATLGMRRLEADPSAVGRVVGGLALVVATTGVLVSGLSAIEREEDYSYVAPWVRELEPGDVFVTGQRGWHPVRGLSSVPGVVSVERTGRLPGGGSVRPPNNAVVRTDGGPGTVEAIRDALPWGATAETVSSTITDAEAPDPEFAAIRRGILSLAAFLVIVNGASLLLAMVDWLMERRRALVVLSALGVRSGTIRRSIVAQIGLPMTVAVALGAFAAVLVTGLFYVAVEMPVVIPWSSIALLAAAAFVVGLVVTGITLPWVRRARSPELLRSE